MCQVSFAEPGLLSRVRETKVASPDCRASVPGAPCGLGDERSGRLAGLPRPPGPSRFRHERLQHPGGFLAARNAQVQPLFVLREQRVGVFACSCSRTGRSPAGPSPPSCGGRSGRPSASFMRSASGMVWSCHGAPSSSSPPDDLHAGHQRGRILRRQRGRVAVQQPGEEPVEPDALLGGERRVLRHDRRERRAQRRVHACGISANMRVERGNRRGGG